MLSTRSPRAGGRSWLHPAHSRLRSEDTLPLTRAGEPLVRPPRSSRFGTRTAQRFAQRQNFSDAGAVFFSAREPDAARDHARPRVTLATRHPERHRAQALRHQRSVDGQCRGVIIAVSVRHTMLRAHAEQRSRRFAGVRGRRVDPSRKQREPATEPKNSKHLTKGCTMSPRGAAPTRRKNAPMDGAVEGPTPQCAPETASAS
jgi:hypothetical protein